MKLFQSLSIAAVLSVSSAVFGLSGSVAQASQADDAHLLRDLARISVHCTEQPFGVNHAGNKILGHLRSHCQLLAISDERAEFNLNGRHFVLVLKDNVQSDGGDLGDLYLQFDGREDQEVLVKEAVLAFGDPILALLLITGEPIEVLSQIPDTSLFR